MEKNHRAAMVNRIRLVIKTRARAAPGFTRSWAAIILTICATRKTKETERLCRSIQEHEARIHRAFGKMAGIADEARAEKEAAAGTAGMISDCEACRGECCTTRDCSGCSGCPTTNTTRACPLTAEPAFYGAKKGEEGDEAADDEQ